MRLVVTGWFLAVAGVASTTMISFVDGFSIQDLQNYQKAPKGLGSPHSGLLLSQPQSPFRMETTRRDTIQMPSQTPMVPWKVSAGLCDFLLCTDIRLWALRCLCRLRHVVRGTHGKEFSSLLPVLRISYSSFVLVLVFPRHRVPMWLNSSISIRQCTGIGP